MKTKLLFAVIMIIILSAVYNSIYTPVHSNTASAPAAKTGSPGDGSNCTGCHSGTATTQANMITSNIDASGYVPNAVYSFTASVTFSGRTKFGFEVSAQNTSGAKKGTLIATTATKLVGSGKYITHNASTSAPSGTKSWVFTWQAPAAGSGPVTFYGAFNATNSSNSVSGDIIYLSSLTVQENVTAGIAEAEQEGNIKLYPNPVSEKLNMDYVVDEQGEVEIQILDVQGKVCDVLCSEMKNAGQYSASFDIAGKYQSGIYFVKLNIGEKATVKKIMVQ